MKVIKLSERTIFVDDIEQIYQETNYLPIRYFVTTKNGAVRISKEDYYEIQQYLLSLNKPIYEELAKEDKNIEKLNEDYYHDKPILINDMVHKINEIIDKINGEGNEK